MQPRYFCGGLVLIFFRRRIICSVVGLLKRVRVFSVNRNWLENAFHIIWEGDFVHPNRIVQEARERLITFHTVSAREAYSSDEEIPELSAGDTSSRGDASHVLDMASRWEKSLCGIYKVNWDVAVDSHQKRLGCGIIVHDHGGFIITAQCKRLDII
jgi:hypothetical protein